MVEEQFYHGSWANGCRHGEGAVDSADADQGRICLEEANKHGDQVDKATAIDVGHGNPDEGPDAMQGNGDGVGKDKINKLSI